MREFWDERAAENPYFFVNNRLDYRQPDEDAFWADGVEVVDGFERLLDFEIGAEDAVVEIGCGIGRITRVLAERAARVVAIDVSELMLERARELNPHLTNVEWVLGDGSTLEAVRDGGADGCFSFVTFQHIPASEVTLGYVREMGRILRPGGWAAFQLSTAPELAWRPSLPQRMRLAAMGLLGRGPRGQSHPAWVGSTVPEADLRAQASAAGLEVRRLVGAGTLYSLALATRAQRP